MSAFAEKFLHTFFQQIPNGTCLIFSIGTLIAAALMLPKRRHHGRFYAFFWGAFLFMVLWRSCKGIISVRYASILIYPMVIATAFMGLRAEAWWRLLCRRFRRLPAWFGRALAWIGLFGCAGGALLIAHHKLSTPTGPSREMFAAISECRERYPDVRVLTRGNEADRISYYTKVPCIPLEESRKELFLESLNAVTEPDRHLLVVMEDRHLEKLEPRKEELRPGAELSPVFEKRSRKAKHKDLKVYFYRNPLSFSRIPGPLPAPADLPGNLLAPGSFGPARFAGSFISRPVQGGGGFRFTFVLSAETPPGPAPGVEVRTAAQQGKGEARVLQLRAPVPGKGLYRGTVTFRVPPGAFTLRIDAKGTAVRLEQFRLTRAE